MDKNGDGYLTAEELGGGKKADKEQQTGTSGGQSGGGGDRIAKENLDEVTKGAFFGKMRNRDHEIARGLLESRLTPVYPDNVSCPNIDHIFGEPWKGPKPGVRHVGADIPAEWGRDIVAMADGMVIKRITEADGGYRGRQIILRHSPEDTGLPVWLYSLYSHFNKMPAHQVGQRVRMGEVLGPNGKSGVPGARRPPHLHLGIFYSKSPKFVMIRPLVVPFEGHHVDPVALFRGQMPIDANATRELPESERRVAIAYKTTTGEIVPANTKIIWPFVCK
jgi:murein DD-endopeptidase MepM/ murein hydrolase activator NlpD